MARNKESKTLKTHCNKPKSTTDSTPKQVKPAAQHLEHLHTVCRWTLPPASPEQTIGLFGEHYLLLNLFKQ